MEKYSEAGGGVCSLRGKGEISIATFQLRIEPSTILPKNRQTNLSLV
jgi:hypothetical protein